MYIINYDTLLDKIHGCWYGKCLGGAAGAPLEGVKKLIDIKDFEEIYNPDLPNDDLDIQLLWLDVLETKGVSLNSCDLADAWMEKCWYPFSEYGYFRKNYERGIKPPYSGIINNSFFKEGMGCPIRSEIWGIISAGNPELAADYAYIDGCLDHADNSIYAEQFLAVLECLAFFESDMKTLVNKAMEYIPNDSKLARCFREILSAYEGGVDWIGARKKVMDNFGHPDFTNVVQNLGFVLIALLYGENDIRKTINISMRCGFDTDCTCASAAAVIGIITGYAAMGEEITGLIKDYFICGVDVVRPSDSIKGLSFDTMKILLSIDNEFLTVTDIPAELKDIAKSRPQIEKVMPTDEGLKVEIKKLKPIKWELYGPYYEQMEQPIDTRYPSPHGEGCVLPDIVCMVNNQVFLDKAYIDEKTLKMPKDDYIATVDAYEDFIPVEDNVETKGQMCVYAKATITVKEDMRVWAIIGNTDGFKLWVNGEELLSKDEIRMYTPYNNFCFVDLKKGNNEFVVKLLRRTDEIRFAIGLRMYDGNHWHRSKWLTEY